MSKRLTSPPRLKHDAKECLLLLRELRLKLGEINSKLDHLVKNYRRFYFVTGSSQSIQREFED
jgi:hypothetical protein